MTGLRARFAEIDRPGRCLLLVVALALALRLAVIVVVGDVPVDPVAADEGSYLHLAQRVADGAGLTEDDGAPAVFRPPLYPLFLGGEIAVQRALGLGGLPDRVFPGILNAIGGAAVVAMTGLLGRRHFGPLVGVTGAALLAVWPNQVLAPGNLITEQLFIPLFVGATTLFFWAPRPRLGRLAAVGVLLGLGTLTRPAAWPVVLAAAVLAGIGEAWRRRLGRGALVIVVALLAMAPWLVHVHRATGRVFVVAAQGQNLCIGNNDDADGHFALDMAACQWPDGRFADPDADAELFDRAVRWIVDHPERQPLLILSRGAYSLLGDSASLVAYLPPDDQEIGAVPADRGALAVTIGSSLFGLIMVVGAAAALFVGWRRGALRRTVAGPLVVWSAATLVTALATFGDGRYHDPLDGLMALAVAWLLVRREGRARRVVARWTTGDARYAGSMAVDTPATDAAEAA